MSAGYGGAPRLANRFEAHKGLHRKAHQDLEQQHLIWNHAATTDLRCHWTVSFGDRLVHISALINPDCLQSALSRLVHIFVLINPDCLQSALSSPARPHVYISSQNTGKHKTDSELRPDTDRYHTKTTKKIRN